uniref:DUF4510 domain-containing protein n=1 Tax=Macrostomum lignano TaxID=282301 RepID=A0A1I8I6A9_9PLAT
SREVDRSLQDRGAGPVFLLVDSLEPSEIILSMSVLSRWPESYSVSLAASSARAGGGLDEVQRKPRDPPNPGSCVAELHNWKSPRLGQQFKRVRTSGTKAVSLSLPAGRHCLRLFAALRQLSSAAWPQPANCGSAAKRKFFPVEVDTGASAVLGWALYQSRSRPHFRC